MAHVNHVRETSVGGVGPAVFLARTIYFIFGVTIGLIVLRMIFLILGANQGNALVDFVYSVSGIFVAPFFGIFAYTPIYGLSVFEISSLMAIIVYILLCWALVSLVTLGSRHRSDV